MTEQYAGLQTVARRSYEELVAVLYTNGWFRDRGAYVTVDGQYGSTGKGVLVSILAALPQKFHSRGIDIVTTNNGPNSGHTFYHAGKRYVLTQLPTMSKILALSGIRHTCYLNGGAVIDPVMLAKEIGEMDEAADYWFNSKLQIHPHAAVIEETDKKNAKAGGLAKIASTGKAVGPAMARKIMREKNVVRESEYFRHVAPHNRYEVTALSLNKNNKILVETPQGYSLGINSGFYPYVTSRECTVAQALADAGIAPRFLRKTAMAIRTFPIRVGNTPEGNSGPIYSDQQELSWDNPRFSKIAPEKTTVTNRVRRIFTFSAMQLQDALKANWPDLLYVNFCNYLYEQELPYFMGRIEAICDSVMGNEAPIIVMGFGPRAEDARLWQ